MTVAAEATRSWRELLRPGVELSPAFCRRFTADLREARLYFGDRIHCPFLQPFFLGEDEIGLLRSVGETIARMGERVAAAGDPLLLDALAVTEAERALLALDPGAPIACTSSRLDAFILPGSLRCAEYNAESPAGLGYAETLAALFERLDVMARFREGFDATALPLMAPLLDALIASYREWGGTRLPPTMAIVDWRDVPTRPEFEMLQARFEQLGVPTLLCDPRDLELVGGALTCGGRRVDLVYRRLLMNDIVARPDECRALVDAYGARAACVANTFRCKLPHKKAFFAVLTNPRFAGLFSAEERAVAAAHVPWTRLVVEGWTARGDARVDLVPHIRGGRETLVLKPNDEYGGAGVTLGWEADERAWDQAIARALRGDAGAWVVQERIPVRREPFPRFEPGEGASMAEVLVDCAPYLFRGRLAGFLTRLSAGGLANVTSGGGQVPSFVVHRRGSP